jgi:hypothetical protein
MTKYPQLVGAAKYKSEFSSWSRSKAGVSETRAFVAFRQNFLKIKNLPERKTIVSIYQLCIENIF